MHCTSESCLGCVWIACELCLTGALKCVSAHSSNTVGTPFRHCWNAAEARLENSSSTLGTQSTHSSNTIGTQLRHCWDTIGTQLRHSSGHTVRTQLGTIEIKLGHSNDLNSWAWPVNGETCQHVFQIGHSLGATGVQCTSALPEPSRVLRGHDGDGQQAAAGRPGHGVPTARTEFNRFLWISIDFYGFLKKTINSNRMFSKPLQKPFKQFKPYISKLCRIN